MNKMLSLILLGLAGCAFALGVTACDVDVDTDDGPLDLIAPVQLR